jgi:hypothetical protein
VAALLAIRKYILRTTGLISVDSSANTLNQEVITVSTLVLLQHGMHSGEGNEM